MTPFVFLPGTLCDERLWHYQSAQFPNHFHVNLRTQDSLEEMLNSVEAINAPSFILVGFSMGGYVAQEFALKFPTRVKHLVVMGSSPFGYPPHEKEVVLKALPMIEKGLFKGITERRMKEFLHPNSYQDAKLRELIQSMAGPDAATVYLRQLKASLERPDLTEKIKNLQCPLTALAGHEDSVVPLNMILEFKKLIPSADIQILEQCGHFVPLEKAEQVNLALAQILKSVT